MNFIKAIIQVNGCSIPLKVLNSLYRYQGDGLHERWYKRDAVRPVTGRDFSGGSAT